MKIRLSKYLKPYMLFVILAPVMMMIEVFMDLRQPAYMAEVVNDGILGGDVGIIAFTCAKMFIAALIGMIGGFGCSLFSTMASANYGADLRSDLFRRVEGFSFNEVDKFSTGSLVTRLTNDVSQVQMIVMMVLRMFVRAPLLCAGSLVMVLSLSLNYTIILAISVPIIIFFVVFLLMKTAPIFSVMQKKLDRLNTVFQENLMGVRTIKAFVRGNHERKRFGDANEDLTNTSLRVMRLMAMVNPILMIVMNAVVIAVIYVGGYEVQAREMRVGDVMASMSYMMQILMNFMMLSMSFNSLPRAMASASRIREVLATVPTITDGEVDKTVDRGEIVFDNVTFTYAEGSGEPVLRNVSMKIGAGEHIGILGSTGAGKSSLVSLIPRFYDPTEGDIFIDGVNSKDYKLSALRERIGYVLQESVLFTGTLEENIKWGDMNADSDAVRRAAADAQAAEYISEMPEGYDSMLGQRGLTLSGGQKQRACIARALLKNPSILIMDDSTSALDLGTESRLNAAIRQNYSSCTRITIAQRIASVSDADKIYVIEDGRIAAEGTHTELLENSEIYRDIYESQMGQGGAA